MSGDKMKFGVHLPDAGRDPSREAMIAVATTAERLGYASVWSSDHIAWPDPATLESKYPYADDNSGFPAAGSAWLDCIGTLQFVAGITERVQLGTTVLILGYRGVVQQAKGWATLDHLAQGRAILGVGVGWMREEFEIIGMPWEERGARADEALEVFEELFSDGLSTFEGRYTNFRDVGFSPKPPRGRIPVWVGGHTRPAFRRTARYGEAFHAAFSSPSELAREWAGVGEECDAIGRNRDEIELTSLFRLNFDGGDLEVGEVGGSTEQVIDQVGQYRDVGVDHIAFFVLGRGTEGRLEAIERFASEIAPDFS
jgi:probable F420-dependent oxidoreductase